MTDPRAASTPTFTEKEAWPALWALVLGFFMVLLDTTIVSVATPAIINDLDAEVNAVVWVTSAYLLAYAVPILITGRLGDRFGPKNVYLIGLGVFTAASLWCGLTESIGWLIAARVVQGFGASMVTPQTMTVITRIFPVEKRGQAMALWGATAGVALLVGPVLGGVLTDHFGWEWIFFINVPVGIAAIMLAARYVPTLQTHAHRFDWLGVVLSGTGMFLLVFGIQEGHQYDWGQVTGPITVWRMIGIGAVVLTAFVWWQARNTAEPLMPLRLFADRNFAVAGLGIASVSLAFTAMGFPLMLWAQVVRGYSPTQSGMLLIPMAIVSIIAAPLVGKATDRVHPRLLTATGFFILTVSAVLSSRLLTPDTSLWLVLGAMGLLGLGSSFLWPVLTATASRNLDPALAGAGAGVYNTLRQVGAVIGSATIALLIDARLEAEGLSTNPSDMPAGILPPAVLEHFSSAMAQSFLLIPAVAALGLAAVCFFERPMHLASRER